ncbi:MAG TPA: hypothetical protein VLX68_12900 [Chitinivibrionales bacterium]|nr:hypothetical protein [Chitinivibrionales bacterium]
MKKWKFVFSVGLIGIFSIGAKLDDSGSYCTVINPVNFYLYDTLLLISDSVAGIHVYSVKNPQAPKFLMRIPLKGNTGIAMKDNVVFANSWGSILAIRLTGESTYEIAEYIKEDPDYIPMPIDYGGGLSCFPSESAPAYSGTGGASGTGGSYAVFAVIGSYLYYLDGSSVITMDISTPAQPNKLSSTYIDWSSETLFPTDKYLFVGGSNGMYVLDRSNPANPLSIGSFAHFRAKDPVVVRDSVAFVTLRTTNDLTASRDELLSVSLDPITNPSVISEKPLYTPWGLAVSDTLLYVGNGANGFSLVNVKDPGQMAVVKSWQTPEVKDFIWQGNRLYVMTFGEIMIYDATDPQAPVLLGTIQ